MDAFTILFLSSYLATISGLLIEYPMSIEKAPFMATVGNCSGAIVSRNLVLVSGKCLCLRNRPTVIFAGTSWSNVNYLPKKEHRIRRFIFEREYGYCSQSRRSDFVLVELEDSLVYSHRVQPIQLYCATHLPSQLAALGFHFPGQLYGFLNEALINVRRGEHRYLQALNYDIPSDAVGPLVSVHADGKQPHLVGVYSHRYGKTSFFKSLDHTSCNWVRSRVLENQRMGWRHSLSSSPLPFQHPFSNKPMKKTY
ncbi:hypothetical protein ECG_01289 [Echinococcus granulosus]|nr:hypothetical protein ECG_01289 [Echinococcus granulosus]CDS15798.1 Peptidase S1 S6 chymotrypsin Hap [Echinococcus granulosus]